MSSPVLLDTDVASAMYKGKQLPILGKIAGRSPYLSFVTFGEMTKWAEVRSWAPHNRVALNEWLARVPTLQSSREIASVWGMLSAAGMKRGRPCPHNDTWIAAVALVHQLPVATLNLKDFEDFKVRHGRKHSVL